MPIDPRIRRVQLPIETPRTLLRLPNRGDVADLRRSFRDPRTASALGASLHSTQERRDPSRMVRRTLQEYARGEHLSLSVIGRESGRCIGRAGLRGLDWKWKKVESLSYWMDPRYWDQGLTTEASWFLCREAFQRLGMRRISSSALEGNAASLAVLRKLGFVQEGRERQAVVVKGRAMDMVLFGLFRKELVPWKSLACAPAPPS